LTLSLGGGEWSASRPGRLISGGKSPLYPLGRGKGESQSRSGHGGEEKKFHYHSCRVSNPGRPACSLFFNCALESA